MKTTCMVGFACALALAGFSAMAQVSVTVDPPFQESTLSSEVLVNVYFTGVSAASAGSVGGAVDLTVQWNSSILQATRVEFYPVMGDPGQKQAITAQDLSAVDSLNIAAVSLLTPSDLVALQGPAGPKVKIATLHFLAGGFGFTPVQATSLTLADGAGKDITPTLVTSAPSRAPAARANLPSAQIRIGRTVR